VLLATFASLHSVTPALREHLSLFVAPEPESLIFPGAKGGPLRRSNFNKMSSWPQAAPGDRRRRLALPRAEQR
jgi:hypothetical protein